MKNLQVTVTVFGRKETFEISLDPDIESQLEEMSQGEREDWIGDMAANEVQVDAGVVNNKEVNLVKDAPPFERGIYQHYKGGHYLAIGPIFDATRDEWGIDYLSLGDRSVPFYRSYENFTEEIKPGLKRFKGPIVGVGNINAMGRFNNASK